MEVPFPAVPDLSRLETQLAMGGKDYMGGLTIATVDGNGYFTALIPDKSLEQLNSGDAWITIMISKPRYHHEVLRGQRFPVRLLSKDRAKAGVFKIVRPKVYYGRMIYENGKPAVPEIAPWPGARVYTILRYSPATSSSGGIKEELSDVDKQGFFSAYLTDEQLKQIEDGPLKIQIYHPSYEEERVSFPAGVFPANMLTTERDNVIAYKLTYDQLTSEFHNLGRMLESIEKLKTLGFTLSVYHKDNAGRLPASLNDLKFDDAKVLPAWIAECVEYIGSGTTVSIDEPASVAIAYDKALFEKGNGTNVLFDDGHVEFCRPGKLENMGISR